jgi:hypothetical protein
MGTEFWKKAIKKEMKEALLITETPFDLSAALNAAEQKYGFNFGSILCGLMHFGLWTRPALIPSLILSGRFQLAPGEAQPLQSPPEYHPVCLQKPRTIHYHVSLLQ